MAHLPLHVDSSHAPRRDSSHAISHMLSEVCHSLVFSCHSMQPITFILGCKPTHSFIYKAPLISTISNHLHQYSSIFFYHTSFIYQTQALQIQIMSLLTMGDEHRGTLENISAFVCHLSLFTFSIFSLIPLLSMFFLLLIELCLLIMYFFF